MAEIQSPAPGGILDDEKETAQQAVVVKDDSEAPGPVSRSKQSLSDLFTIVCLTLSQRSWLQVSNHVLCN